MLGIVGQGYILLDGEYSNIGILGMTRKVAWKNDMKSFENVFGGTDTGPQQGKHFVGVSLSASFRLGIK